MKKLFLLIASAFLLSGCTSGEGLPEIQPKEEPMHDAPINLHFEQGLPVVYAADTEHTTYLMLSPYGTLDAAGAPVKGAVSELFYENTVVWKAEAGTDLPGAVSSVSGATFRGWAYYDEDNDHVFPDYYTKVPAKSGLALKAIFDGANAGGGGGGGGGGSQATIVEYTLTGFEDWVPNDGAEVFAWSWGGASGGGAWSKVTLTYQGSDNNYNSVRGTFEAPNDITGFNLARCSAGTTQPSWTVKGDAAGRIYNKTANVDVSSGVVTYTAPNFVDYSPE